MNVVRWVIGRIILLLDFIFTPRGVKRSKEQQALIDAKTAGLTLYQFKACPFCVKVRRTAKRHTLNLRYLDAKNDPQHRQTLLVQGGKIKVPCLRIAKDNNVEWLYESDSIVKYLEQLTKAA
ncbi:glutathione S-transferase N-terminal domain-containing protein [Alteromonadaceae bacterium BrNp21-10]|nr:glutathione S-transferase N-terminal domain-containing protein [Alteromonadaceae bacterium BrNp21-10]